MLPSADGTCRDWRGLAEKAGFTRLEIEAFENRQLVDLNKVISDVFCSTVRYS